VDTGAIANSMAAVVASTAPVIFLPLVAVFIDNSPYGL
jgi:hypothetical protein